MNSRLPALCAATLLLVAVSFAKDKKPILPAYILNARTVAVIIDPHAGMDIADPRANQIAESDVEAALRNWGRLQPVIDTESADLIIVVRKGSGRLVDETVSNPRQNNRTGMSPAGEGGLGAGGQPGQQPPLASDPSMASPSSGPHPQTEVGNIDDSFEVYQGNVDHPLDSAPGWKYVAKDGLRSPSVPAVDQFRYAVQKAEEAAAAKKKP